jgi:hypothetical protein
MPLPIYLPTHPEARLTPAEKSALITGLLATAGGSEAEERGEDHEEEHENEAAEREDDDDD